MNKAQIKKIKKTTFKKNPLVLDQLTERQKTAALKFNDRYKQFLNQSKTERGIVCSIRRQWSLQ